MSFDLAQLEKESVSFEQVQKTLLKNMPRELERYYRGQRFVVRESAGQAKRVVITWNTSAAAAHPNQTVYLPPGLVVTGGGARANWSGAGNLLTASYPFTGSIHGWAAESKDHGESSPASLTVWVIGMEIEGISPG